ncbi:MAG TPA: 2-amino-4-hydroxy-6-hydroxymethyldihydropteridine diphosphokinase [Verrucomicrobiae bacterium]|nr:2-amino-4-hydroxy-6-hydroxymethyldihydropteridine diphosphokinase [Verrucomicrobiae bacterium]
MATVYLALGSNVGDGQANIETAVGLLGEHIYDIRQAPLYRSKAIGYTDQADFLNTVLVGETELKPAELLAFMKSVEERTGRVRRFHWGPREIDVDLILYDKLQQQTKELTIPHPAFRERDFVLQPLQDLDPDLIDPVSGRTVSELLERLAPEHHSILKQIDETD